MYVRFEVCKAKFSTNMNKQKARRVLRQRPQVARGVVGHIHLSLSIFLLTLAKMGSSSRDALQSLNDAM